MNWISNITAISFLLLVPFSAIAAEDGPATSVTAELQRIWEERCKKDVNALAENLEEANSKLEMELSSIEELDFRKLVDTGWNRGPKARKDYHGLTRRVIVYNENWMPRTPIFAAVGDGIIDQALKDRDWRALRPHLMPVRFGEESEEAFNWDQPAEDPESWQNSLSNSFYEWLTLIHWLAAPPEDLAGEEDWDRTWVQEQIGSGKLTPYLESRKPPQWFLNQTYQYSRLIPPEADVASQWPSRPRALLAGLMWDVNGDEFEDFVIRKDELLIALARYASERSESEPFLRPWFQAAANWYPFFTWFKPEAQEVKLSQDRVEKGIVAEVWRTQSERDLLENLPEWRDAISGAQITLLRDGTWFVPPAPWTGDTRAADREGPRLEQEETTEVSIASGAGEETPEGSEIPANSISPINFWYAVCQWTAEEVHSAGITGGVHAVIESPPGWRFAFDRDEDGLETQLQKAGIPIDLDGATLKLRFARPESAGDLDILLTIESPGGETVYQNRQTWTVAQPWPAWFAAKMEISWGAWIGMALSLILSAGLCLLMGLSSKVKTLGIRIVFFSIFAIAVIILVAQLFFLQIQGWSPGLAGTLLLIGSLLSAGVVAWSILSWLIHDSIHEQKYLWRFAVAVAALTATGVFPLLWLVSETPGPIPVSHYSGAEIDLHVATDASLSPQTRKTTALAVSYFYRKLTNQEMADSPFESLEEVQNSAPSSLNSSYFNRLIRLLSEGWRLDQRGNSSNADPMLEFHTDPASLTLNVREVHGGAEIARRKLQGLDIMNTKSFDRSVYNMFFSDRSYRNPPALPPGYTGASSMGKGFTWILHHFDHGRLYPDNAIAPETPDLNRTFGHWLGGPSRDPDSMRELGAESRWNTFSTWLGGSNAKSIVEGIAPSNLTVSGAFQMEENDALEVAGGSPIDFRKYRTTGGVESLSHDQIKALAAAMVEDVVVQMDASGARRSFVLGHDSLLLRTTAWISLAILVSLFLYLAWMEFAPDRRVATILTSAALALYASILGIAAAFDFTNGEFSYYTMNAAMAWALKPVIAGVVISSAAMFGWMFWHSRKHRESIETYGGQTMLNRAINQRWRYFRVSLLAGAGLSGVVIALAFWLATPTQWTRMGSIQASYSDAVLIGQFFIVAAASAFSACWLHFRYVSKGTVAP